MLIDVMNICCEFILGGILKLFLIINNFYEENYFRFYILICQASASIFSKVVL